MNLRKVGMLILFLLAILRNPIAAQNPVPFPELFKKGYIEVWGRSEGKQTRFQALRSAEVMAQQELLKTLQKIKIFGSKEIDAGVKEAEWIGFLQGAMACGNSYQEERGQAAVCLRFNLYGPQGLYDRILPWLRENRIAPEYHVTYRPGSSFEPPLSRLIHDGLILDVRTLPFEPALLNRVLTFQDQLVFDPLQIEPKLLIEHGCSRYCTDLQSARDLLQQRGSQNPLVLSVRDLKQGTDARISPEQAEMIAASEKTYGVLSQAKIVFLVRE